METKFENANACKCEAKEIVKNIYQCSKCKRYYQKDSDGFVEVSIANKNWKSLFKW